MKHMFKTTAIIILLISKIQAQSSLSWKYRSQSVIPGYYAFSKPVEDSSGNVFVLSVEPNSFSSSSNLSLLKFNKYGAQQTFIDVMLPDTGLILEGFFILPNQHYLAVGLSGKAIPNRMPISSHICVLEYDNNLQLIRTQHTALPEDTLSFSNSFSMIKTRQNTITMIFGLGSPATLSTKVQKIVEIDMQGNILKQASEYIPSPTSPIRRYHCNIEQQDPITGYYNIIGTSSNNYENYIFKYNTNLVLVDSSKFHSDFSNVDSGCRECREQIKYVTQKAFITNMSFSVHSSVNGRSVPITKIDAQADTIMAKIKLVKTPSVTTFYFRNADWNSIDFIDSSKIYVVGTYDIVGGKSYFACWQIDKNLNIAWSRFIGGEASYIARHTTATKDGGVIISGIIGPRNNLLTDAALMIKIGPNGEVLNTNELPKGTQVLSYLVGPNPVQNILNIQSFTPNTTIQIVNSLGKVVMQQPITQQQTELNLSHLSAGVYFYRFSSPNGFILQSGKLVKE